MTWNVWSKISQSLLISFCIRAKQLREPSAVTIRLTPVIWAQTFITPRRCSIRSSAIRCRSWFPRLLSRVLVSKCRSWSEKSTASAIKAVSKSYTAWMLAAMVALRLRTRTCTRLTRRKGWSKGMKSWNCGQRGLSLKSHRTYWSLVIRTGKKWGRLWIDRQFCVLKV